MTLDELNLPADLRDALDAAVAKIVEIAEPEVVILFGSWAEGRAAEDSDIDLLVVVDTEDRMSLFVKLRAALGRTVRDHPLDLVKPLPSDPHLRNGMLHPNRIRMSRVVKNRVRVTNLDNLTSIHHNHPVTCLRNYTQVMRNHNYSHTELFLKVSQQRQYLRLDRHVERSSRFVAYQQVRVT